MRRDRHLLFDESKKKVYYLRYDMKLTEREYDVLDAISLLGRAGTDEIIEHCGLSDKSRGNVAVHICSLNRKADIIGERRLILYADHKYFLNEKM
ncbi:MAG: hypothetical protein E7641_01180 [Ruminococcaceae bacterium]|nr:hypothetical protein [Oscillospiraceae bacterium]